MPPDTFSVPAHLLDKLGLSLERLCARAGVAPTTAWRTDDFFRLWAALDEELVDRAAGLRFGTEGISRGYGVAAIVALHAPDFRGALAALSRYKRLTCPELVEVETAGDEVVVRYRWLQASGDVPRLLIDTTLASLKELARQGTAGQVLPTRVELTRRAMDGPLLRRHFDCPVVFGAAHNAMVFPRASLDVAFVTADGGAFARVLAGLERALVEGEGFTALVGQVRVAIAQQLSAGHAPAAAAVARRLATSSRTLQRRLADCGTSFQQQLAAVRRILAGRLLANTDLDTVAIAMLLGFEEPNSFARAFRGWEQTTPLRWRERLASTPSLPHTGSPT
ncbi:AraC family transcriptional regulator ligand-binding domain-containing protein [Roseateles chitinivorans]|uniref:AraC family transcriptional regulator n=1 Tax=Roseateles chitinivorans TaxID=2917965 RepID=UPI003D670091